MRHGRSSRAPRPVSFGLRLAVLFGLIGAIAVVLLGRAVQLQLVDNARYQKEGDERFLRVVPVAATRAMLSDRNGEPLAVSTPVESVWVNPKQLAGDADQVNQLARVLQVDRGQLARRVSSNLEREFLYVARGLQPAEARRVHALKLGAVHFTREYRRYYPAGEVTGHLLGFTNVDGVGQEGAELMFDNELAGQDGAKRVIQDRQGQHVEDVESISAVRPGQDVQLSIDLRIQYLAYRELKAAIREQQARAGAVVVLDVQTGEILAMVNQPAYNPNDREQLDAGSYRNRAATDLFEPGSSIKPFVVAAGFAAGKFNAASFVDTTGGSIQVGSKTLIDDRDYGVMSIAQVLEKSSNVGMAHIALALPPKQISDTLTGFGFGEVTGSAFPGESAGLLSDYSHWRDITIATMSHGYGLSVTPLQLARAYATLGGNCLRRRLSLVKLSGPAPGERIMDGGTCRSLVRLLESVVTSEGTAPLAQIQGYRVAGKTGTAQKAEGGGYATDKHVAFFGGVAPVGNPRLAAVVVIDEPGAGKYHGGEISAPVFSRVVGPALRLLGVPPDETAQRDTALLTAQAHSP